MDKCPILDVHSNNAVAVWPSMCYGIDTAEFVAIDLELSGLGDRSKLASKCLDERYTEIGNAAKSRSIISIGISCFKSKLLGEDENECKGYVVQTYNILALCSTPYVVEPEALKFLTQHGFDFNKQYQLGLSYSKGEAGLRTREPGMCSLNSLFLTLSKCNKPIVVHNGLVDIIFLYHNLYLNLPPKLTTFLADIEELFPAGIYDTKYLAEYHIRLKASYLQYVFRNCLKWNEDNQQPLQLEFLNHLSSSTDVYHVSLAEEVKSTDIPDSQRVCQQYAAHGWCTKGVDCTESHNVSLIVNCDKMRRIALKNRRRRLKQKERKKRQRTEQTVHSDEKVESEASYDDITPVPLSDTHTVRPADTHTCQATARTAENCHRAGVDAFMTGLTHAVFCLQLKEKKMELQGLGNKLYLSGKNLPLQITKGNFGRPSQAHINQSKSLQNV